jgi:protein-tyrosine phosphatase
VVPDVPNFRDAGGLASGSLPRGLVYRSSELDALDPPAQAALISLGVRRVFDLRTEGERRAAPDRLPEGTRLHPLDVMADMSENGASAIAAVFAHQADRSVVSELSAGLADGRARQMMIDAYIELVGLPSARHGYRQMLLDMAKDDGASIVHCTAGKDRTGWGIAVVQLLMGADVDHVEADYLASNEAWADGYTQILRDFAQAGGDADALGDILWVRPAYLQAALDAVDSIFGSLPAYVSEGLGLGPQELAGLRARLAGQATGSAN